MPRMAFGRVAAPEDDQIAAVFHFTESTRDLADFLKGQG